MATKIPFKIEVKKDVAYRDVLATMDKVLTTVANRIQCDEFSNSVEYPALEVTGSPDMAAGITVAQASRLASPITMLFDSTDIKGEVNGKISTDFRDGETVKILLRVDKILNESVIDNFYQVSKNPDDGNITVTKSKIDDSTNERVSTTYNLDTDETFPDYKYQDSLFISNAYNLGCIYPKSTDIGIEYKLAGKIGGEVDLKDIFYITSTTTESGSSFDIYAKHSDHTDAFTTPRIITLKGDIEAESAETYFRDREIKIENTKVVYKTKEETLTDWMYVFANETIGRPVEELDDKDLNEVDHYYAKITDEIYANNANVTIIPPEGISKDDLIKLQKLNLQLGSQENNSVGEGVITLFAYCSEKPTTVNIKTIVNGRVDV